MKFGPVGLDDARGAVLAHSVKAGARRLRKGTVLGEEEIAFLGDAGVSEVIAARLEAGDVGEDAAATRLGEAMVEPGLTAEPASTGRVNLLARWNGLFRVDRDRVDAFNRIDTAITLATVPDYTTLLAGEMAATVKIIPLAVAESRLSEALALLEGDAVLRVKPFEPRAVGLVATELPSLKTSVMDKTARLLAQRLTASGSQIKSERRVPHDAKAVAEAIRVSAENCELIVVFGASAVVDEQDVIPAAIEIAGGAVERVGMPVDPGNLLVLGRLGKIPVIGAPGCARSPKENGFDWVLARILAGEAPTSDVIAGMGVGGLLAEIPSRPSPRQAGETLGSLKPVLETVILAAGRSSRMQEGASGDAPHKLLAEFDGVPLIRRTVETALAAGLGKVHVVTGYRATEIAAALTGLDVNDVHCLDYQDGMASSLRSGLAALSDKTSGMLVMLADMPFVRANDLRRLAKAFGDAGGQSIVRAASGKKRGNPLILPKSTFAAIGQLEGDIGARSIVASSGLDVIDVDIGDAALIDVDTREAVTEAGGVLKG
ncbi:MAG: 4-diphosphocytidyl-2C-methyl-D-erythritol kinase [Rhizobiaceae bacterium MnEN-MB40S]|nr:MAG: 4-diphosphocytidyl-2C-methyl-D-erythritol kinase [Rhizobiaceae bacterium MnEN-MB40S]